MEKKNYIRPALRIHDIDLQGCLASSPSFSIDDGSADAGGSESKAFTSGSGIWGSMSSKEDNASTDEEE